MTNDQEQSIHDRWVAAIARKRMGFPNADRPTWRTYVNEPDEQMGVTDGSRTIYPDMVVVDEADDRVVMIGEVETASTVVPAEIDQWRIYGEMAPLFYLYVPRICADKVLELVTNVPVSGLRTYENAPGAKGILVRNLKRP